MQNRIYYSFIWLPAFIGGFVFMAVELIYPRISAIWFGNILEIWAIDLSVALLVIAIGYRMGAYLLKRAGNNIFRLLIAAYFFVAAYFVFIPQFYAAILDSLLGLSTVTGAIIFALIFMVPTMGILAITSPFLVEVAGKFNLPDNRSSFIFGISSAGGAIAMLVVGLYLLPYYGIRFNCYLMAMLLLLNAFLLLSIRTKKAIQ